MKEKKKVNGWAILFYVVFALLVISEALVLFAVWQLQMLPGKYFLIVAAVMVVLALVLGLLLRPRKMGKWQKKEGHGRQIAAAVISLVVIAGCLFGFSAISQVNGTISAITSPSAVHVLMNVYVLAEDPAESLADASGYIFAIADSTAEEDNQSAVADIENKLGSGVLTLSYDSAFAMIDALYAGEVNAIILDESYVSILGDLEGYSDFETRTRILNEYTIKKSTTKHTELNTTSTQTVKDVTNTPFLVYISGNDARKTLLADGGSDVNILVAVNPVDKQILLVNTPRDYYVVNPASGNGSRDKLSHCGLNGIDNCVEALSELYGHTINYYARINFTGFSTLIDAIGGVTVYSDVAFTACDTYYIQKGENYLNGAQALAFARERKNLTGGDNDRGKNQMRLISAMIDQLSSGAILTNYSDILNSLEGMFTTTLSANEIASLVKMQLNDMSSWEILSFAVTGDNGNDSCWAVGGGYGYVMYPHQNMVDQASALIQKVLDGKVLTQDDLVVE